MKSRYRNFSAARPKTNRKSKQEIQIFITDRNNEFFDEKTVITISLDETVKSLKKKIMNSQNKKKKYIFAYVKKHIDDCPSDIILRGKEFINISGYYKFKLLFNGRLLKDNETIKDCGIQIFSNIFLLANEPSIKGGRRTFNLVDVRKEEIEHLEFSKEAPDYRNCCNGLNIFGYCSNRKCETKGNEVVVPIGFKEFDLGKEISDLNIRCPKCEQAVRPTTCGFLACAYNFVGSIIDNGKVEDFKSKTFEAPSDYFTYYKPSEKLGNWYELKIYTLTTENSITSTTTRFEDLDYFDC